jgi:hypothetical protein
MFIFKRGNSLKNVQNSTKKKPKNVAVLKTAVKKTNTRNSKPVVEKVVEMSVKEEEEFVATKKNTKKTEKNKEEENI